MLNRARPVQTKRGPTIATFAPEFNNLPNVESQRQKVPSFLSRWNSGKRKKSTSCLIGLPDRFQLRDASASLIGGEGRSRLVIGWGRACASG